MMLIRATRVGGTWEQAQHHPKEHLGQELLVWVQESGGAGVSWRGHPCPCPQPHPWWVLMGHSPQLKAINPPGYRQGFLAPWLFLGQDRAGGVLGGELGTNKNPNPQNTLCCALLFWCVWLWGGFVCVLVLFYATC